MLLKRNFLIISMGKNPEVEIKEVCNIYAYIPGVSQSIPKFIVE